MSTQTIATIDQDEPRCDSEWHTPLADLSAVDYWLAWNETRSGKCPQCGAAIPSGLVCLDNDCLTVRANSRYVSAAWALAVTA